VSVLIVAYLALSSVAEVLATPVFVTARVLEDSQYMSASRDSLLGIVKSLKKENIEYYSLLRQQKTIERENEKLRSLLGITDPDVFFEVTASVIGRPLDTPYGLVVIDKGEESGIEVGDYIRIAGREYRGEVVLWMLGKENPLNLYMCLRRLI
jgi:cell shape-determining protein MreC